MVLVAQSHEPKWLKYASRFCSQRAQHLGHAVNVSRLHLKGDFHEITLRERACQLQQSPGFRDDLQPSLSSLAVAQLYQRWRCWELNTGCTMSGTWLGIVGHAAATMASTARDGEITEAHCPDSCGFRALPADLDPLFGCAGTHSAEGDWQRLHQVRGNKGLLPNPLPRDVAR
jgi:hypothetical protein